MMDPGLSGGTPDQQGPPPGAVATPIAAGQQGPPPGAVATPITTQPPSPLNAHPLTANPKGEGVYQMKGPGGVTGIPYSNVETAKQQGFDFSNSSNEAIRYNSDYDADPNRQQETMEGVGKGMAQGVALTSAGLMHITRKVMNSTGQVSAAQSATEKKAQQFGDGTQSDTGAQDFGKFVESAGEFLMGDEALKGLGYLDKMKQVLPVLKVLEKSPLLAKVVDAAIQQGTVGAVQGGVKSGGDLGAAATEGAMAGGVGAAAEGIGGGATKLINKLKPEIKTVGGVQIAVPKANAPQPPTPAQAAGAEAYANEARGAVKPHIEATNAASANPHMTWGIDEAGNYTEPVQASVTPKVNADDVLAETHDFTGASQKLIQHNAAAYDALNKFTDGKFRAVNDEVKAARAAAADGSEEGAKAYANAQAKMQDLFRGIDANTANAAGIDLPTLKASWTNAYTLADIGKALDRSLNGLPGDTTVSQTQRGINGNVLEKQIRKIVTSRGIDNVRAALGPGRLENLQAIAAATKTNAGRAAFNKGIQYVAHALPITAGYHFGGVYGAGAAEAATFATQRVLNAVRTNPEVGQKLLYAIEYGARPENYARVVAGAIASQEKQTGDESK